MIDLRMDQEWFETLSSDEIELFTSDGISMYDLAHIDSLLDGKGTWFHAQLLRLFTHGDQLSQTRLAIGFPGTAAALASRRAFRKS